MKTVAISRWQPSRDYSSDFCKEKRSLLPKNTKVFNIDLNIVKYKKSFPFDYRSVCFSFSVTTTLSSFKRKKGKQAKKLCEHLRGHLFSSFPLPPPIHFSLSFSLSPAGSILNQLFPWASGSQFSYL